MSIAIEIVFNDIRLKPSLIWEKLVESHPSYFLSDQSGNFYNVEVCLSQVGNVIKRHNKPHFHIEFGRGRIHYTPIVNNALSFLGIESCITSLKNATEWVNPFLALDSFVSARVYDVEYEYWQNAIDPLQFEANGKSYNHLPMRSNELPFPLEKSIIDTSNNPGRRCLRSSYIEAVGSIMWIGKSFWELTKAKQEKICEQDWIDCKILSANVTLVKSSETLFTLNGGESLTIQNELRKLLFPAS